MVLAHLVQLATAARARGTPSIPQPESVAIPDGERGIGYDDLRGRNPGLIYCSVSAFGAAGPYASYPGTDPVIQAMSGVMSLTEAPRRAIV